MFGYYLLERRIGWTFGEAKGEMQIFQFQTEKMGGITKIIINFELIFGGMRPKTQGWASFSCIVLEIGLSGPFRNPSWASLCWA